jgi:meso-butanediol dehydrogenase / (S,S)-butanediol dehydrogenase / diacetyl reductase
MNRLADLVAIVTGAGKGIGRGIALNLAREGASVVVADIDHAAADNVRKQLLVHGGLAVEVDVTNRDQVIEMVHRTLQTFGRIDILVNNAGVHGIGKVAELDEDVWDRCFDINVKGTFLCCKHVIPHMTKQGHGKIVNIASIGGKTGVAGRAAYCSSKFAIVGLTQVLAKELGPCNINVNAVCPGFVYTEMWDYIWDKTKAGKAVDVYEIDAASSREFYDKIIKQRVPLGRPQTPEDIGKAVVFLVSDDADNITGQAINVCGGMEVH